MSRMQQIFFFTAVVMCLISACSKDPLIPFALVEEEKQPVLPAIPFNYGNDTFPSYFNSPPLSLINSIQHPITANGATLGRVLFYDKKLSANNKISCGSCHLQSNAFSDPGTFSFGFKGEHTARNSMALENTRFSNEFFRDLRAPSLEMQVLMPVQDHTEMGMNLADLMQKLQNTTYYPELFRKAFGTEEINSSRISIALAEFIQSMNSYQSRYDEGIQNGFSSFTAIETDGMNLFFSSALNCSQCHATANFYGTAPLNNGLDSIYTDNGRGTVTGDSADDGKFKVPSLRNIVLSAPYMHDGRFATLEEVVEHYNSGIRHHRNLDHRLTTNDVTGGPPKQFYLTAYQKASLVAFLETLTDQHFVADKRFSDPFR